MKPLPTKPTPSLRATHRNITLKVALALASGMIPATMAKSATARLSAMMFLEYVIWGSWLPLLALYLGNVLGFTGAEIGWIFATQAVASIVGLFAGGQMADRLVGTEKLLAVSRWIRGG